MTKRLPMAALSFKACSDCVFRSACGGLVQQDLFGCFSRCGPSCDVDGSPCDYVCPEKPDFWRQWAEVGGFYPELESPLLALWDTLPQYVPMVRHGYSREQLLPEHVVALNTFDVVDSKCDLRMGPRRSVSDHFAIGPDSRVLLVSVNQDPYVESFWAHHDQPKLRDLARLNPAAVSTPNYSLFDDAPRFHSVRNLWRIVRSAEHLAEAGLTPILHVNAVVEEDWRFWTRILIACPEVRHVCKEFQTGLQAPQLATRAIDGLRRLQDGLGRALHPIVIGGQRVVGELAPAFESFTLVDSVPFMATMMRKRIMLFDDQARQYDNPTPPGAPLDALLQDNISVYRTLVQRSAAETVAVPEDWHLREDYAGTGPIEPPMVRMMNTAQ